MKQVMNCLFTQNSSVAAATHRIWHCSGNPTMPPTCMAFGPHTSQSSAPEAYQLVVWSAGGRVQQGESPAHTAAREVEEETHWQLAADDMRPLLSMTSMQYVPEAK